MLFSGTRARGTLTLKRRCISLFLPRLHEAANGVAARFLGDLEAAARADLSARPQASLADADVDLDALLEDGAELELRTLLSAVSQATRSAWTRRRRDKREAPIVPRSKRWRTDLLHRHPPCSRKGCLVCSARAKRDLEAQMALGLRPNAGPREFWDVISKTQDAVDTDETLEADLELSLPAIEAQMWRVVLLVRCHDRKLGLRLNRDESQRKLLDLRLYELVFLYLRNVARAPAPGDEPPPSPPRSRPGSPSRGAPPTLADLDDRDFDATLEFADRRHD